jgi:glycosyltransferase involved in cell wall biosynthesis
MSVQVSIIVPAYNPNPSLLEKLCLSIHNQSYQNLDVIFVDDGSRAELAHLLEELCTKHKFRYFRRENQGVSSSRNFGISKAKGEFIAFVDCDDCIHADYIQTLVENCQNADIVCCNHIKHYENGIRRRHKIYNAADSMNMDVLGTVWAKLYRTSLFEKYTFNESLSHCEDVHLNFRLIPHTRLVCIPYYGYEYYVLSDSASHQFDQRLIEDYYNALRSLQHHIHTPEQNEAYKAAAATVFRVIVERQILPDQIRYNEKKRKIEALLCDPLLQKPLQEVNLHQFSFTRALPIYFARKHWIAALLVLLNLKKKMDF